MRISERFINAYLRAEDLEPKKAYTYTIADVDDVTIGDDERIVLTFKESDKQLPLNKTNAVALAEDFGDETDEWIGKVIELRREKTMFQGKMTPCVRARASSQQPPPQQQAAAKASNKEKKADLDKAPF